MAVAPELVHALSEVSELESALAQASLSREGEALTPRSRQQLAALTGRVKALGASLTTLTKHPLIAEASNAAAMKEFAARFRAALLSFHAVQNGTPPSAIGQTPSPTFTTGSPAPADERKGKVRKFKMRGELKKLGAKGVTQWRRRYMKVEGDKLLYFLDERDLKPRGAIDLLLMSDVDWETAPNQVYEGEPGEDEASGPSRFRIRTPGRDYHLEADTPRLARLWVRSLRDWKQRSATMSVRSLASPVSSPSSSSSSRCAPPRRGSERRAGWRRRWRRLPPSRMRGGTGSTRSSTYSHMSSRSDGAKGPCVRRSGCANV